MTQLEEKGLLNVLTQGYMMVSEDLFIVIAPSGFSISPLNAMRLMYHQSLNYHSLTKRGTLKMRLNALMYIYFYGHLSITHYKTDRYK